MSIFDTNVETLTPEGGKYTPTKGLHQAKVIALVDLGDQECVDQKTGEKYMMRKLDIIFAVEEKNSKGEHMTARRTVSMTMGENSVLSKINRDAKWNIVKIGDILGKTAELYIKIVKTKADKDFPKVEGIDEGAGFTASGALTLPFWYADVAPDCIAMLQGVTIGAKLERKSDSEACNSDQLPF